MIKVLYIASSCPLESSTRNKSTRVESDDYSSLRACVVGSKTRDTPHASEHLHTISPINILSRVSEKDTLSFQKDRTSFSYKMEKKDRRSDFRPKKKREKRTTIESNY